MGSEEEDCCSEIEIVSIPCVEPETTAGYIPPLKKTLAEIKNMDEDDESLARYKKALLSAETASPSDDPRLVIVEKMTLVVGDNEDCVLDLRGDISHLPKITVKEGTEYKIKVYFKVHHEIVCGLRYHQVIKRKGLSVDKQTYMVGSYGPKPGTQSWESKIEEAPSGMMFRGTYHIQSKFLDDDKVVHLEWSWDMEVKKDKKTN